MKKRILIVAGIIIFFITSAAYALKFVFPQPQGYVSDYANALDRQTRLRIENLGRVLERNTGSEMAVVIVKTTLPYDHLEYANRLFAHWRVGKEGQDNGVLFLLALKEQKVRIEVGYGLEEIINDGKAGEILDKFVIPKFKEGKYSEGLYNGSLAIAQTIGEHYKVPIVGDFYPVQEVKETSADLLYSLFFLLFIFLVFSSRLGLFPWIFLGGFGSSHSSGFGSFGGGFGGFGGGLSGG
ncbi:MAG: TPM domain-containing protein, partial [Candidatus Margulisbacteria bacterium]|nr:TPM domain-containing protein [Candidatus Margulisiibacteriota bacterium]